mgnify:CR=1 FL=1
MMAGVYGMNFDPAFDLVLEHASALVAEETAAEPEAAVEEAPAEEQAANSRTETPIVVFKIALRCFMTPQFRET